MTNIKDILKEISTIIILVVIIFLSFLYGIHELDNKDINTTIVYIALIGLCIISLLAIIYIKDKKQIKPEKAFLTIVPIFCILMMIAMPMTKGHDETIHGQRIYEYAEGKFVSNGQTSYLEEGIINALNNKSNYKDIIENKETYSTNTNKIESGYRVTTYSPINYLPQIIGIELGRIFTDNSMVHLYLARLGNIICSVTILYFAIKKIPYGKNLLLLLSIIPIGIEGFCTLSADGMIISCSFLWIAYILKLREESKVKISKKQIIFLAILAIIISLSKTVYITLLPLLFILPNEKFNNKKQKIIIVLSILFVCSILDVSWYLFGIQKEATTQLAIETNGIKYILSNPIGYIKRLFYTIVTCSTNYIQEAFGGYLEWNETIKIQLFPSILLVLSVIISTTGKNEIILKKQEKICIFIVIIACVCLIFTSLFLCWSEQNIAIIEGIKGRYFIPILPLIYLLFGRKFLDDTKTTKVVSILGAIMQIYVILEIMLYHM